MHLVENTTPIFLSPCSTFIFERRQNQSKLTHKIALTATRQVLNDLAKEFVNNSLKYNGDSDEEWAENLESSKEC